MTTTRIDRDTQKNIKDLAARYGVSAAVIVSVAVSEARPRWARDGLKLAAQRTLSRKAVSRAA